MIGQSKQGAEVGFITLLSDGCKAVLCFYQPQQTMQKCWAKTIFSEPNWHVLTFLCLILICGVNTYGAPMELLL